MRTRDPTTIGAEGPPKTMWPATVGSVGDDVGNEGHGAIKVLLIANVGVRKGDVNDAKTRVPHWAEGGRIADPRAD